MNPSTLPAPVAFVPVIPDSAPFSPEQRAWLNGFIAGVLSRGSVAGIAAGAAPAHAAPGLRPITLLFGSQTGGAEGLAKRAAKIAGSRGFAPTILDMGQTPASRLAQEENLLVITSTYGEGEPPDNARALHGELHAASAPLLPKLRFSVLGLGDTNYTHFCKCAKDFDARLEALGGARAAARVDCDLDYESKFLAWLDAALTSLGSAGGAAAAPAAPVAAQAQAGYSRQKPYPARLLGSRNLNGEGSAKQVHHIAFELGDSALAYEPGDALGVWPHNCPELVGAVLHSLGCDGEEEVKLADGTLLSLRRALTERCDLGKPTAELAARLGAPGEDRGIPPHVADLIRLRPESRLAPADFVRLLRPLAPRLYSISSSPRAHPGEVHLTVGVVGYDAFGRPRKGVCSTFLAHRAQPGEVRPGIFVHANAAFRLPESPDTPIIMVGPGTGIAPFRAFLEERRVQGAKGRSWLFFGDQRAATDFLYREEIAEFQRSGALHRLDTAFSRDQAAKVYVQHRMKEQAQQLFAWLEAGACFYVCGDAARMAKDVDAALHDVVTTASGRTRAQAEDYVQAMRSAKRYRRDVY